MPPTGSSAGKVTHNVRLDLGSERLDVYCRYLLKRVESKALETRFPDTSLAIEEVTNRPDLLLGERTLGTDLLSCVPSYAFATGIIELEWPI